MAGELGVRDLVVPRAEGAVGLARLVIDAEQEVRVAAPGAVEEGGLVDDVRSAAQRYERLLGGGPQVRARVPRWGGERIVERGDADPSFSISTTRNPRSWSSSR